MCVMKGRADQKFGGGGEGKERGSVAPAIVAGEGRVEKEAGPRERKGSESMTNYNKWDSYVANLSLTSSDEEDEGPAQSRAAAGPDAAAPARASAGEGDGAKKYGWGKPLDERGQIDRTGELTVGNAKGNALSTNAAPQKVSLPLTSVAPPFSPPSL